MTTRNMSLPEDMEAFIKNPVAQEAYALASAYCRDLIREAQRRKVAMTASGYSLARITFQRALHQEEAS